MALATLSLHIPAGQALSNALEIPPTLKIVRIAMPDRFKAAKDHAYPTKRSFRRWF